MMQNKTIEIIPMQARDIANAVGLISQAMNQDEGKWASETMHFHFKCAEQELDDGHDYYLWWEHDEVKGIVGLHQYAWGPPENVWLAWFAVSPAEQGKGYDRALLDEVEKKARQRGFRKFFVETYAHPDFDKAIRFYQKYGFTEHGRIANYLPDGSQMIVLGKSLSSGRRLE
nr:GNAT family N-acetyltransferase [Sunxiuqinia sp.]